MAELSTLGALRQAAEWQRRYGEQQYAPRMIPTEGEPARTHTGLAVGETLQVVQDERYATQSVYVFDAENLAGSAFHVTSPSRGFTFENTDGEWTISGAAEYNYASLHIADRNGNARFTLADYGWSAGDTIQYYAFARSAVATDAKIRIECRDESGSTVKKLNAELCSTKDVSAITYVIEENVVDMAFMVYCGSTGMTIDNSFVLGIFHTPNAPTVAARGEDIVAAGDTVTTMPFPSREVEMMDIVDYIGTHGAGDVTPGYLTPEDFGARGDGTGDDTDAVNACIAQAAQSHTSVRGYGTYRCAGTVTLSGSDMDIAINRIASAATDTPAIEIRDLLDSAVRLTKVTYSGAVSTLAFDGSNRRNTFSALYISSTQAKAIWVRDSCTEFSRNGFDIHRMVAYGTAIVGSWDAPSYYTEFRLRDVTSYNGSCVSDMTEVNFTGTHWTCPNGYIAENCTVCRFYHLGLEHEVLGGYRNIRGCTIFYGRTIELMDIDSQGGHFGAVLKIGAGSAGNELYYSRIAVPSIDVSEMMDREALIAYRNSEEIAGNTGMRAMVSFPNVIHAQIENCTYYQMDDHVNEAQACGNTSILGYTCIVHVGRRIVIPCAYQVQDVTADIDMRDFTYPFLPQELNVTADAVVTLGDSYCSLGIHELIVRQDAHAVTIRDRDENVVFSGSEQGSGTFKITWIAQPEIIAEGSTQYCNLLSDLVRVERIG